MNLFDVGELFGGGTGMYEKRQANLGKMYGGLTMENMPYLANLLKLRSQGSGLTPGMKAQEGTMLENMSAGYTPWLQSLTAKSPYGQGVGNIDERVAGARGYARDRSALSGNLLRQSEEERKQYLQWLMALISGAGQGAYQSNQAAAGMGEARTGQGLDLTGKLLGLVPGYGTGA